MTVYTTKSRAFQSPQWGDSSKVNDEEIISAIDTIMFQSPQWGDNSKDVGTIGYFLISVTFSPRNGEIILK